MSGKAQAQVLEMLAKGERIHTENSYKYAPQEFEALLREAGFASVRRWDAAGGGYYVFLAS